MPCSIFEPIGLWRCSARKPLARQNFEQAKAGLGGQFATDAGTTMGAFLYANAIGQARTRIKAESAAMQRIPARASGMMPVREEEYGIVPGAEATMRDRREEYARRFRIIRSTNAISTEAALRELLGEDFVALRVTPTAEIETLSQADGLDINYQRPDVERKIVRLLGAVSFTGAPSTVSFEMVHTAADPRAIGELTAGDAILVEPGRLGRSERIIVTNVASVFSFRTLTATFQLTHDAGVLGFTHPYPGWSTNKRNSIVVLATAAAALDPETRRAVDELMTVYARSVSSWSIAAADGDDVQLFEIDVPSTDIASAEPLSIAT